MNCSIFMLCVCMSCRSGVLPETRHRAPPVLPGGGAEASATGPNVRLHEHTASVQQTAETPADRHAQQSTGV